MLAAAAMIAAAVAVLVVVVEDDKAEESDLLSFGFQTGNLERPATESSKSLEIPSSLLVEGP